MVVAMVVLLSKDDIYKILLCVAKSRFNNNCNNSSLQEYVLCLLLGRAADER